MTNKRSSRSFTAVDLLGSSCTVPCGGWIRLSEECGGHSALFYLISFHNPSSSSCNCVFWTAMQETKRQNAVTEHSFLLRRI